MKPTRSKRNIDAFSGKAPAGGPWSGLWTAMALLTLMGGISASGCKVSGNLNNPGDSTVFASPLIDAVNPPAGPPGVETQITITGKGFLSTSVVTVDGAPCGSFNYVSSTEVNCLVPARNSGTVSLRLDNPDLQYATFPSAFTYRESPSVSSVSPTNGSTAGGTAVTITGTGFASGATVSLGGSACTGVSLIGSTQLNCTTDAHSSGTVDVVVTNPDTQKARLSLAFSYSGTPVLSAVGDAVFPSAFVDQGTPFTFDVNNLRSGTASDAGMTYSCSFDRIVDSTVSGGSDCSALSGILSFNSATGVFSWTPDYKAWGPFELKVTGTNSEGSASKIIVVNVREPYSRTNLQADLNAELATGSGQASNAPLTSAWKNLFTSGLSFDGTLTGFAPVGTDGWRGNGAWNNPYSLVFDGVDDRLNLGSGYASNTSLLFTAWLKPNAPASPSKVILGNGGGTGNGFVLHQLEDGSGRIGLKIGAASTYTSLVTASSPSSYWRLGESTGTTAADSAGTNTGTYIGGVTLGGAGALPHDTDKSATFNGVDSYVSTPTSFATTNNFTIEMWAKPNADRKSTAQARTAVTGNNNQRYALFPPDGTVIWGAGDSGVGVSVGMNGISVFERSSTATLLDSVLVYDAPILGWTHIAVVYTAKTPTLYVNGQLVATGITSTLNVHPGKDIGEDGTGYGYYSGALDEVAVYPTALSAATLLSHYRALGCNSRTVLTNNSWAHVAGSYDGSNAQLYVDGRLECSVPVTSGFTTPATDLYTGATQAGASAWSGSIADLKLYSSVAAATIKTHFNATVDRFRQIPLPSEPIVTNGLVLNLDAAFAQGIDAYSPGCAGGTLAWFDRSDSALSGILGGFSSCGASSGWNGTGTTADPYRLTFDGIDDSVTIDTTLSGLKNSFTLEAWVKTSATHQVDSESNTGTAGATGQNYLFDPLDKGTTDAGAGVSIGTNGVTVYELGTGYMPPIAVDSTPIGTGWNHIVVIYNAKTPEIYVNGASMHGPVLTSPRANVYAPKRFGSGGYGSFAGSAAKIAIYNRALSGAEVLSNCNALKARFGITCP